MLYNAVSINVMHKVFQSEAVGCTGISAVHLCVSEVTRPRKEAMRFNVPHLPMYCNVVSQPVESQTRNIAACLANIAIGDTKEDKKDYHMKNL